MSGAPDPKPARRKGNKPRRIIDQTAVRTAVLLYPACAACGAPSTNGHHLVPRSKLGDDVAENIVALCGLGNTSGCHGKVHGWDLPTRRLIRQSLRPEQIAYIVGKMGGGWLAKNYPD